MELLKKKDGSGKNTTTIQEISELLDIASLRKLLRNLKADVENLKKEAKIERKDVVPLISKELSTINSLNIKFDKITELCSELKELINENELAIKSLKENNNYISKGEVLNISNVGSIEKNKNMKIGSFYYNKSKDEFRLLTKNGWISK